jgi:LuxR family transcriptional regulator, maltose regulon positive regulatory protein
MSAVTPQIELVVTKLWPPVLRPVLVPRERPLSILRSGEGCTLTLVDAPAGSGKTTALAQWLAADADTLSACWFSVDPSDNDPTRFWTYAIMAVRGAIPGFGEASLAALRGGAEVATFVLPPAINELAAADSRLALVIDDYHLIRNPAIHRQVEQLLDHLPDGVQVVISTRVDPPLPLSRWRGRGQLAELRAADLRFSDTEASALLERMQLSVGADDVERLVERTEGWAAGLSLAGLSMSGRADTSGFVQEFAGTDRHVLDYLGAEVLAGLEPEAQHFLVQSSVLQRLSGPLCDAVMERRGSGRLLQQLERSNAFVVPLGGTREWYRLHHLFGEVLQSELRSEHPGLVPLLHRRASRWFAEEGMTFEAIEHAVEACDAALVAELLTPVSLLYLGDGQADTVRSWLKRLGEESVAGDARLCLVAGARQIVLGDDPAMTRWLDRAEDLSYAGPLAGGPASIEAGVATIRGIVTSGRLSEHLGAARRAVELERDDPTIWQPLAAGGLASALYWTGDPEEARPCLEIAARSPLPLLAAAAYGYLGMIAADDGDAPAADHYAAEGERLGEEHKLLVSPPYGRVLLARGRTHLLRGALAAGISSLEAAISVLRPGPYPLELADALLWLAQARQLAGSPDTARAARGEAQLLLEGFPELGILAERWEATARRLAGEQSDAVSVLPVALDELSARERDVLQLLATALSEAEIGQELFISYHTVHSHVRTIYRKLGTSSRAQTVERARTTGLLPAPLARRADGAGAGAPAPAAEATRPPSP